MTGTLPGGCPPASSRLAATDRLHVAPSVADCLQPWCDLDVSASEPILLELRQVLAPDEDTDVLGQAAASVDPQCERAANRVWNTLRLEQPRERCEPSVV